MLEQALTILPKSGLLGSVSPCFPAGGVWDIQSLKTIRCLFGKCAWKPRLAVAQYSRKWVTLSGLSCTEVKLDDLMVPLVFKMYVLYFVM